MKGYNIDFAANCITVTKAFNTAAGKLESNAYKTMMKLRELNMPIRIVSAPSRKQSSLSYQQMIKHIECLADAEEYMAEFEAVRRLSRGERNPYRYVLQWYEKRFPNHSAVPEFDDQLKLINTPDHYAA